MKKYFAGIAIPPGGTVLEMLEVNNMTQAELAARINLSKKHVNKIINGKAPITSETALKLEKVFKLPASFWLNLESNYQEALARIKSKNQQSEEERQIAQKIPYAQMAKMGWVKATRNIKKKVEELRNYFRVSDLSLIEGVYGIAFRTTQPTKTCSLALASWLERGESLAKEITTETFSETKLKEYIPLLRKMTLEKPEVLWENLKRVTMECGIALVIVPHLEKTYAQGAVKWLTSDKIMMQLSLRYKYSDIFWFSFFHELGHILLHGKRDEFIEFEIKKDEYDPKEKEADDFAEEILISTKEYEKYLKENDITEKSILNLAKKLEIHPGIIVGRLQHDKIIKYNQYNNLRSKLNWDNIYY